MTANEIASANITRWIDRQLVTMADLSNLYTRAAVRARQSATPRSGMITDTVALDEARSLKGRMQTVQIRINKAIARRAALAS